MWTTIDTIMTAIMLLITVLACWLIAKGLEQEMGELFDEMRSHDEKLSLEQRCNSVGLQINEVVERARAFKGFIRWSVVENIIEQAERGPE